MFQKIVGISVLFLSIVSINFQAAYAQSSLGYAPAAGVLRHYPTAEAQEVPNVTSIGITAAAPFSTTVTSNLLWVVTGSVSGIHAGTIVLSDDRRTVIFHPLVPFGLDDSVSVTLHDINEDGAAIQCSFHFITCVQSSNIALLSTGTGNNQRLSSDSPLDTIIPPPPDTLPPPPPPPPPDSFIPPNQWGFTTTVDNNPTPGRIFLSLVPGVAPPDGLAILDDQSNLLFNLAGNGSDFILQPNGVMTYFSAGPDTNLYFAIDSLGNTLQAFGCTNGIAPDGHELLLNSDGGYTLLGQSKTTQDMSAYGGSKNAIIEGGVIQTFDASGNLIFDWRGIDHYNVQDDIIPGDVKSSSIDFEHANSIDIDSEGNYLLSNRNLSEITKINGKTGDIIWRFGGNHNQFKLIGDTLGISCQHYVRWLANGDILLFDNGVYHPVPESRAVEFYLDTNTMTATRKWQYRHNPPLFADVMGDAERLDNGNTFIGWGSELSVGATEVDSMGTVVYEMELPGTVSYRALKYPAPSPIIVATGLSGVATASAQSDSLTFSVVPNANGYEVHVETPIATDASISLFDVTGRVVQRLFDGNILAGTQNLSFSTASLANGVYFCSIYSSNGNMMRPILVAH